MKNLIYWGLEVISNFGNSTLRGLMFAKHYPRIAILVCSILLISACSPSATQSAENDAMSVSPTEASIDTDAAASESGAIDACALLTQADAENALGKSTGPAIPSDLPPVYSCSYETSDFDVVEIVVVVYNDAAQAQAGYAMAIEINGYPELNGIGERAYNAQPFFDVNFLSGNLEVSIDILDSSNNETQLQKATELAQIVFSRLP